MNTQGHSYSLRIRGISDYSFAVNRTTDIPDYGFFTYLDILDIATCVHDIPETYDIPEPETSPLLVNYYYSDFSLNDQSSSGEFHCRPTNCTTCNLSNLSYTITLRWGFFYTEDVIDYSQFNSDPEYD